MNVLAMERELKNPDEEAIKEYLAGNLCRCSGYMSQLRAVKKYLGRKDTLGADVPEGVETSVAADTSPAADKEGGAR